MGTSPQHAITTSGSLPWSLLAHSQIPMPAVQCLIAWSMVSHCGAGCLPATTTFTQLRLLQALLRHPEQRVRVGGQVDADHLGLLVHHVIDEAGVLVAEAVVILPPDVELSR